MLSSTPLHAPEGILQHNFGKKTLEFQILWSLSSVGFHTLTLQLPIQTQNSVAPELQVFVSSFQISAK